MATTIIILSIALPWFGALCVWLAGDKKPQRTHYLAMIFSIITGCISLLLLLNFDAHEAVDVFMGGVFGRFTLIPDGMGVFLAIVAAVIGCLAVIFSIDYMHEEEQLARYYSLVLLFIGAMIGLVLSGSLLFMFVFWEITAFCSYALISFHNDDPKAVAGGIKALIMTQLGGLGLLAGAILCYVNFSSYQISVFLAEASSLPQTVLSVAAFGFLLAAAAKSAQVPFQTWLPDAMEAPTPISALIHAATMVNAGVYLLARFYPAFKDVTGWSFAVMLVGFLSAFLAAVMALASQDLKRVLAYSTISQLGYMVYAIGVGGVFASQFHLMSHSVFKALLFLGAGAVIHTVGTRDMRQMGGLGVKMPLTRTVYIIGAWGLAGLPVANGFFSKEAIMEAGHANGPVWAFIGMAVVAGLTALYSTRMIAMVFYGKPDVEKDIHDAGFAMRAPLVLLAVGTITTWLLAGPFASSLKASMPFHEFHLAGTFELAAEVILAPPTWIVLGVIGLGILLWLARRWFYGLARIFQPVIRFAEQGLGFEHLNRGLIKLTNSTAKLFQKSQTGQLNWNLAGLVIGLLAVILYLTWRT